MTTPESYNDIGERHGGTSGTGVGNERPVGGSRPQVEWSGRLLRGIFAIAVATAALLLSAQPWSAQASGKRDDRGFGS